MSRQQLVALVLTVAVCVSLVPVAVAGPTDADDWPGERGGPAATGSNAGNAPSGTNVTLAHEYPAGDSRAGVVHQNGTRGAGEPTTPAVVDGTMYVGYDHTGSPGYHSRGDVVAYDTTTGEMVWNRTALPKVRSTPSVGNDRVYVTGTGPIYDRQHPEEASAVGGRPGGTFAMNATTGEMEWSRNVSGQGQVLGEDRLYVNTGRAVALNATTGETVWDGPEDVRPTHLALSNGTLVLTEASRNVSVVALNATTGTVEWNATLDTSAESADPSGLAIDDGTVYVSDGEDTLGALSLADGAVEWRRDYGQSGEQSGLTAPAVQNGTVYVSETLGHSAVYAHDAETGATEWQFDPAGAAFAAPTVANGTVYVPAKQELASGDRTSEGVYALNASTGERRWTYADDRPIDRSTVAVTPAEGHVYVTLGEREIFYNDGALYALNASDEAPADYNRFVDRIDDDPAPSVTLASDPPNAEDQNLPGGYNVTLTANASDTDGTVTAIEWDVDADGEFEQSGESVTIPLDYCGALTVTVRVTDDDGNVATDRIVLSTV
ncbi:PQQ-binding-like beta-propeller repeat protein [Haloarcula pellucida]|uniref:Outer membrane protein assembly factor BamB, contains PQQ-like beta-propeller repeat n=1 Tax=Haloarcula pellucida TaxID=1427151 RepID=A0A830GMD0_9EURY|nr:PQQ-binding-like beta-propeller repeat protein [Halomicroarcula pellucida]MBX0348463.1 PQQ-binding-like beta-propeller repeat protein [Halomicroarcula pellucida]GGN93249.1 hypothetical protein GCM10009030_18440 [Halomicroarcula pellucida]